MRGSPRRCPGTGPYRISSYVHDKTLPRTGTRYFHQWSAAAQPAGFLDPITWVKVADTHAAADAVRQGAPTSPSSPPRRDTGVDAGAAVELSCPRAELHANTVLQGTISPS